MIYTQLDYISIRLKKFGSIVRGILMKFVSSLRDPVYGVVPITSIEQDLLKLPLMNRLKKT